MKRVIIDSDTAVDDFAAIAVALLSPELDVLGISTVFGNLDVHQATLNAKYLLSLLEKSVDLRKGSPRQMVPKFETETGLLAEPPFYGKFVHGDSGLGDHERPAIEWEDAEQAAVPWIVEQVMASPGEIWILALGPLTNIALALLAEPRLKSNVAGIVFMGGRTSGPGNVRPLSVANAWNDPEALHTVLHSGVEDLVMVPQDCTHSARTSDEQLERIRRLGSPVAKAIYESAQFYRDKYREKEPEAPGVPLHDVTALGFLIDPDKYDVKRLFVTVDLGAEMTRGQTIVDTRVKGPFRDQYTRQVTVCMGVDNEWLQELMIRTLSSNR